MTDNHNSTASIERKILKNPTDPHFAHYAVTNLIALQARTKLVASLLQRYDIKLTETDIGRMFKNTHGFPSPRGLDTWNADRMVDSFDKALHASVFYGLLRQYEKLYTERVMALIEAYKAYLSIFNLAVGQGPMAIGTAHSIDRYIASGTLSYAPCLKCKLKYVQSVNCAGKGSCPACQIIARSQKPQLRLVEPKVAAN